ncbi:hypothetical protein PR048_020482 [Dryococelus australis]|uniref:DUF4371 domain-containing protein n=1 Tax=Dryococelus australis TaxID=614101 RepID=A0ABQ9H6J5_9NEOP|nr:hypothetical protein PR048_020482 [Dryococelus australis]
MHEFEKSHMSSQRPKSAANKKVVASVVSTVIFCGTRDLLPLWGKEHYERVLEDLSKLKIEAGHNILKEHIEKDTIRNITTDIKNVCAYSILADESSDIPGKEQIAIVSLLLPLANQNHTQEANPGYANATGANVGETA